MSDALLEFLFGTLRNAAADLGAIIVTLVLIIVLLAGIAYVLMRRLSQAGINVELRWDAGTEREATDTVLREAQTKPRDAVRCKTSDLTRFDRTRQFLASVQQMIMLSGGVALLIAAIVAFESATPGNGFLLVALLLAGLSLAVFGMAHKQKRQEHDKGFVRSILDDLRGKMTYSVSHAEPEIHSLSQAEMARARDMALSHASLDDISRAVHTQYSTWSPERQQAFQRLLQAALKVRTVA
jgi:hypothetical protein